MIYGTFSWKLKGKTHHDLAKIYPKKMIICCIGWLSLQSHKILCKVWLRKCLYMCGGSVMIISTKVQISWLQRPISTFWWHEWNKHRQLLSNRVKFDFMCNGCKNIWHYIVCSYVFVIIVLVYCFALITRNTMLKVHPQWINKMCKYGAISQVMLVFIWRPFTLGVNLNLKWFLT